MNKFKVERLIRKKCKMKESYRLEGKKWETKGRGEKRGVESWGRREVERKGKGGKDWGWKKGRGMRRRDGSQGVRHGSSQKRGRRV